MKRIKNIYLLLFGLTIFLAGCSSTYTLKDFPSEQKFYKEYNNFAENKKVKITLLNNKSFYSRNGTEITKDSLYTFYKVDLKSNYTIPTSDIKKIKYLNTGYKTADILLINGEELKADNISFLKDAARFEGIRNSTVKKALMPIDKIKSISYENHWLGLIPGIPSGIFMGLITGYMGFYISNPDQLTGLPVSIITGFGVGAITGTVVGWLLGFNYTYVFNP